MWTFPEKKNVLLIHYQITTTQLLFQFIVNELVKKKVALVQIIAKQVTIESDWYIIS